MARPGLYENWRTKDGLLTLEGWARDGLNDEQIAHNVGIRAGTLYEWKNRFPEIAEAIKKGKRPVDVQVENALYRSALGFKQTVKKPIKLRRKDGSEYIEYGEEEIYIAPNITAQIFWLKNRKRDKWCDKPEPAKKTEEVEDGFMKALEAKAPEVWDDYDEAE